MHLKNINTFSLFAGQEATECAERYGITENEVVALGYLAKKFAKEKLENKYITLLHPVSPYNPAYYYRFVEIMLPKSGNVKDGIENFGILLLKEGLGYAYGGKYEEKFNSYKDYEDIKKIKKMAGVAINTMSLPAQDRISDKLRYGEFFKKPVAYRFSPQKTFNNVTLFLINPNSFNKPSYSCATAGCKALLSCINAADTSIDFALYGIDRQNEILEALSRAKTRGVKIRGVVDIKSDGTYVYSDTAKLKASHNVILDNKAQLMHNKFFIFDNKKVFTGTMNISSTGSGGYNSNTAILLESPEVAEIYKNEFEKMYFGIFQAAKTDSSAKLDLNKDTKLAIYFSPKGKTYEEGLLPIIQNAKEEILVSIFYLTHRGIISALNEAASRGVSVKIIYDAVGANNMKDRIKTLRAAGVKVKVENWGGKNHQKDMIIDRKYFVTGSANFSNSGMNYNDENVLIFENKDIAEFCREHFLKLYNSLDEKYLKFIPRAESFESGNSCYDGIDNNFDGKTDSEDIGCKR